MKKALSFMLTLTLCLTIAVPALAMIEDGNVHSTLVYTDGSPGTVTRKTVNLWSTIHPEIQTIVAFDGTVSVLYNARGMEMEDNGTVNICEFNAEGSFIRSLSIDRLFPLVGSFARDESGNYYIFYGKAVEEDSFNENNMALAKYSANGVLLDSTYLIAQTYNERWASGYSGVKEPFSAGTCRMEISGNLLSVYFGRRMFRSSDNLNHQASYGILFNLNNLQTIDITMPSAGHSFNQDILPISNGFIFVDRGDVTPRSFMFSFVNTYGCNSHNSFSFKQGTTYQNTFSELGGIAEAEDGFIFVGTYEKSSISLNTYNDSRNIFVLTMSSSLENISTPIWLTDYSDTQSETVISPKIARIAEDRYVLMWTLYSPDGTKDNRVLYSIIDSSGEIVMPAKELLGVELNLYDPIRFNATSGLIQWATESGNNSIVLYSFDPFKSPSAQENIDLIGFSPDITVRINSNVVEWTDAAPFIDENSRTMVPLRAVADALNLTVSWDSVNRAASFADGTKTIYFPIDSTTARTSDGVAITMDTAAVIVNDRTYAPIRYLAEFFGFSVGWDGKTRTVQIS